MTTLGYAILSLLAWKEFSGYDLAQHLKVPIGFFWTASHSQIYPELARLESNGLVRHYVVEQQDRPDKKVYQIAEAGREALREWVTSPPSPSPARDEMTLKSFSLWLADRTRAIALFEEQEQLHLARLAQYEEDARWFEENQPDELARLDTTQFGNYVTLQRGLGYEREYVAWCRWVLQRLRSGGGSAEAGAGDE